jgi:lipopolysaccharide export system protein LptC
MTARTWLRDRPWLLATVALALAAGAAQWLLWWLGPVPKANDIVGPPRSSYTLHDARVNEYDVTGQPSVAVQTPRLERREGDESLYLDAPTFQMPSNQSGVSDWQGQAQYGWINQGATLLKLQGQVYLHRAAYAATPLTTIRTADVTVWPHERRLATAAPAQMTQGGTRISGVGMLANLNDKHLELLDDVHATFPPRQRQR